MLVNWVFKAWNDLHKSVEKLIYTNQELEQEPGYMASYAFINTRLHCLVTQDCYIFPEVFALVFTLSFA